MWVLMFLVCAGTMGVFVSCFFLHIKGMNACKLGVGIEIELRGLAGGTQVKDFCCAC